MDLTKAFLDVVRRPDDAALDRFRQDVLERFGPLFETILGRKPSTLTRTELDAYLVAQKPLLERMIALRTQILGAIPGLTAKFKMLFPELPIGTPVVLLPSFNHFDGRWDTIAGTDELLLGIDGCARRGDELAFPVLFQHELTHVYHARILRKHENTLNDFGQRTTLWLEGFAVLAAQSLNPGTTDGTALGDVRLATIVAEPRDMARLFIQTIDDDRADVAKRWFESDGTASNNIPPRAGYALGLLVARGLSKTRSFPDCAALYGSELKRALDEELRHIAS